MNSPLTACAGLPALGGGTAILADVPAPAACPMLKVDPGERYRVVHGIASGVMAAGSAAARITRAA